MRAQRRTLAAAFGSAIQRQVDGIATTDDEERHVVQQRQGRVRETAQVAGVGMSVPLQRRVYLPLGGLGDSVPEPLPLSSVLSWLRAEKIEVNERQRAVLERWCVDGEEHIYNGMFDLRQLMRDVDAAPATTRTWQQGLDPQAFAWRKLLDSSTNKNLLLAADRVVIHLNVDAHVNGTLLNAAADFPVRLFRVGTSVHAVNLLGEGRLEELKSYLRAVGAPPVEFAPETPTSVVQHLGASLRMSAWPKSFHLSVMPISILNQVDLRSVVFRIDGRETRYPFACLQVINQGAQPTNHIVCGIHWANGMVVEHLLQAIDVYGRQLESVNLHGICGSLTPALARGQMVAPLGSVHSLSPEHPEIVHIRHNDIRIHGATFVMDHGHVTTILQETDENIMRLLHQQEIQTLEMEAYHLVKGMEATRYNGPVKIIFTISDIMTSPYENLNQPEVRDESTLLARKQRNKLVIEAFGLGESQSLD